MEEARVVARGEQLTRWFARHNDAWLPVDEHPAGILEEESTADGTAAQGSESCPPGTVWLRRFELAVPRGTRLLRRQSFPQSAKLDPMQYVERGLWRVPRARYETQYVVVGNYRLRAARSYD